MRGSKRLFLTGFLIVWGTLTGIMVAGGLFWRDPWWFLTIGEAGAIAYGLFTGWTFPPYRRSRLKSSIEEFRQRAVSV